jgi:hypothetical protein
MPRFRVHPEARLELVAAAQHYEDERPGYGAKFRQEYEQRLERALTLFRSGAPFPLSDEAIEVRSFGFHGFPYSLVVAEVGGLRTVIAVAHAKRKPGYWRERVR